MAKTVIEAFESFLKEKVNLDKDDSKKAKSSRDWLIGQIHNFPENDEKFPNLYSEKDIFYGSFSRKTKIRPLDDIDLMICMSADQCYYTEYVDKIEITVPNTSTRYLDYVNDGTSIMNSKKIINKFVSKLVSVPQYKKAEIKRNHEAATLNLNTYDWTFDIVPSFFTMPDAQDRTFFIIPDGAGNWKKTDPRMDSDRLKVINVRHNGYVLDVIRAVKFWNKRDTMPTMSSYLIENMILDYYSQKTTIASQFVDIELVDVFNDLYSRVYQVVNDPKRIQGDLNDLSSDQKYKISQRAHSDYIKAKDARKFEVEKKFKESIGKWTEIFGSEFPKYEE